MKKNIAVLLIVAAGTALTSVLFDYFCLFRHITGLPCPGCGMTRAWAALLRGDIAAAVAYHPLFWSAPLLIAEIALYGGGTGGVRRRRAREVLLFAFCALYIAVWIIRLLCGWRG